MIERPLQFVDEELLQRKLEYNLLRLDRSETSFKYEEHVYQDIGQIVVEQLMRLEEVTAQPQSTKQER